MDGGKRGAWTTAAIVLALSAFGLWLRWRGIEHALPHVTFRDGYYVYTQVELMRTNDPSPQSQPFWGFYPHLVSRIVAALPDPDATPVPVGATLAQNLDYASATWLQIREVSVLLSLLAVVCTFFIARSFLSQGWAAFATFLVATSLLQIFFAQQEKCHGPASGMTTLAVLAALHLRRRPSFLTALLAATAAAAAIGTLQSGAAALLPLAAAAWMAMRKPAAERPSWRVFGAAALASVAVLLASVRSFYPFHFAEQALAQETDVGAGDTAFSFSGHHVDLAWIDGSGFKVLLDTLISFEPTMLVLSCVALVALLARRRRGAARAQFDRGDLWVVLAYVVPYTLVIGVFGKSFHRFVMPLIPYLAIAAAFGARALSGLAARFLSTPIARRRAVAACAILLVAPRTVMAWRLGELQSVDDTNTQAAAWITRNVDPDADRVMVLPYVDLPLFYSDEVLADADELRGDMFWRMRQSRLSPEQRNGAKFHVLFPGSAAATKKAVGDDPIEWLRSRDIDYVVIQQVPSSFRFDVLKRTREALQEHARLVKRISPLVDDDGRPAKLSFLYTASAFDRPLFLHMFDVRCEGVTLEIYRLTDRGETPAESAPGDVAAQIKALEALGYAGGTTEAPEQSGVTIHDRQRVQPGLNLAVSGHAAEAELLDLDGRSVHRWARSFGEIWPRREFPQARNDPSNWRRARLAPNGELFAIFEGLGLVKLDRDSNVLWSYDGLAHHDLDVATDGRIFVLTRKAHIDAAFRADKPILEDFVTTLDAQGRELASVSLLECFRNSTHMAERLPPAGDIFHTNALQLIQGRLQLVSPAFPAGSVLVSLRTTDQLAVVDLEQRTVAWSRTGSWKQQHEPVLLEDGHMLVFDNKGRRERSSVLEIEPLTGEVVWSYAPKRRGEFYTPSCGSVQRLANGDTLIVSSEQGRALEVTRAGKIVWEYWNPHRVPSDPELVASLYDLVRLPVDYDVGWNR